MSEKTKNYKNFTQIGFWGTALAISLSNLPSLAQTPGVKSGFEGRPVVVGLTESFDGTSGHFPSASGSIWFKGGAITNTHVVNTHPVEHYATENNRDFVQYKYKMTFGDEGFDLAILARSLKELAKQIEILLRQPTLVEFQNYLANHPIVTFETRRDKMANKEFDYTETHQVQVFMTSLLGAIGESRKVSCIGFTLDNTHLIPNSSGSNGKGFDGRKEFPFVHFAGTGDYLENNTTEGISKMLNSKFASFPDGENLNLRQKLEEEFEIMKKIHPKTFGQFTDLYDFLEKGGNIVASVPFAQEIGVIAQQKLTDGKFTVWKGQIYQPIEK